LPGALRSALVEVLPYLDLALLERDQVGVGPGVANGLERFGQFDLLDAFGEQKRDPFALKLVGHWLVSSFPFAWLRCGYPCRGR